MPHRTAGCGKSSLRPLMAGSSPSLPDGSNPSAAIVQSASDVQCSRLLKTTMEVVAEGVETPDCLAWLRQAGCDTVQGFLFARPMPAAAFVGFVNQWRNTTMNANEPSTSCCVCCKEIPLDAAFTPEGAEYVEHFCGLECYQSTPNQWSEWDVPGGQLTTKGGVLEIYMGHYMREWLAELGMVTSGECPTPDTVYTYANSLQRTVATAQFFITGAFPGCDIPVHHQEKMGTMDPTFNPVITDDSAAFSQKAVQAMEKERSQMQLDEALLQS